MLDNFSELFGNIKDDDYFREIHMDEEDIHYCGGGGGGDDDDDDDEDEYEKSLFPQSV